jgi:RecJ-like exonuclease
VSEKFDPARFDKQQNQPAPGDEAPKGTPGTGEAICPECEGTGKVDGRTCANCDGSGKIVQGIGGA